MTKILFEKYYFTHSSHKYTDFKVDLKEVVEYVSSIDAEAIYVTNSFSEPYIFFLFYSKENPHNFIDTVKHFRNYEFNDIKSYGKYYFYLPNKLFDPITGKRFEEEKNETKKAVIVKFKDEIESDDLQNYNMKDIGKFVILEPK